MEFVAKGEKDNMAEGVMMLVLGVEKEREIEGEMKAVLAVEIGMEEVAVQTELLGRGGTRGGRRRTR